MPLSHRSMEPRDVEECVAILKAIPTIASRYGSKIELLAPVWLRLLPHAAKCAIVIIDENGNGHAPICFFGITVFVRDGFLHEMKTAPQFWVGPELAERLLHGKSPLLSDTELREANTYRGLNLVVWEGLVRPGYELHQELQRLTVKVFLEYHRGYLLKEAVAEQTESAERLAFTLASGGFLWNPEGGFYVGSPDIDPNEVIKRPYVAGTTRELELERRRHWAGSWVGGALFDYRPPILGLSGSEQRLLTCALSGAKDDELARMLEVSLSSVKQMWLSIYRRAEDSLPAAGADLFRGHSGVSGRGKEKRRSIVAYVREHPEELRPAARKRLSRRANCGA